MSLQLAKAILSLPRSPLHHDRFSAYGLLSIALYTRIGPVRFKELMNDVVSGTDLGFRLDRLQYECPADAVRFEALRDRCESVETSSDKGRRRHVSEPS